MADLIQYTGHHHIVADEDECNARYLRPVEREDEARAGREDADDDPEDA